MGFCIEALILHLIALDWITVVVETPLVTYLTGLVCDLRLRIRWRLPIFFNSHTVDEMTNCGCRLHVGHPTRRRSDVAWSRVKRRLWSLKYAGSSVRSRRCLVALKCRRPADKLISSSCRVVRREIGPSSSSSSSWSPGRHGYARSRTRCLAPSIDGAAQWPARPPTPETDDRFQYPAARAHWSDAARRRIFLTTVVSSNWKRRRRPNNDISL